MGDLFPVTKGMARGYDQNQVDMFFLRHFQSISSIGNRNDFITLLF